jgi:hypothetical protein
MAEREGFDFRHFSQVLVKTRHGDNILGLCTFQAHFQFPVRCLPRPPATYIDLQNGITGITNSHSSSSPLEGDHAEL